MDAPVFLRLFLFSQAISIIKGNLDDHGLCHQQKLKLAFCVYCGSSVPDYIAVTIVAGENRPNGTYLLFCVTPQWICSGSMTEIYNTTSDTLEIGFIFNHTIHGGRYLWIIRERNGSQENKRILLKPCLSGFTTNASFYNESHITVDCQHSSFNYSNSLIIIKIEDGTDFGVCSKVGCLECKRLPDGIQCTVPYIPGKAIQCILDGAIYNISAPDIATTTLTPETSETISTTLQGTSKDTIYTTQATSYTSPEIELPTSNENSDIGRFTSTEKSTPLQSVTTIPESSATSSKIITTTVESSSLSRAQNVTTPLTDGLSTSKSIKSTDNLSGSLNITTEYPQSLPTERRIVTSTEGSKTESTNSLSTEQAIATFTEGQSLNMTTESPTSLPTEQRIVTSTEDSKTSVETIGSRTVKEETTTEYLETTVKPKNASSNGEITIINQNIIDQGFCHKQGVNIQLYINCGIPFYAEINVAIVTSKYEIRSPNYLLTCRRLNDSTWYCPKFDIMTGKFNSYSSILDVNFMFNITIHAGYYVRMISSCDGNQETKHIHLIPCFSGFTVNTTFYNATSLVINCQHTSFNDSISLIRIKLKGGNDLGACSKTSCDSCKRLRDGIQCDVLYDPESIYQCVLDSAIYNISLPTTQPEIQTTTPQNVSTFQKVTTASENINVSEKSVLTSTDSSSTTLQRIITSSEGSTAYNSFTKTSSEGTTVKTFDLTLTNNTQATFSKDHLTTESTESGEISTSQDGIESSSTSRENVESTTSAPHFELTSIQSTKIITTAPRDEFNVQSSFYNETFVIINCQHASFNYSSSVIRIKSEGGDDFGSCFKTMCYGCKRLPEGIQCIVPYTPGTIFQCIFDGIVYNISLPANHVTQITLPGTTTTSERTTANLKYRSSSTISMTSKIQESSTTQTFTSPARLSTEPSFTTGPTNLTTEQIFRTTESQNSLTSTNITPSTPDISSTSPIITTTSMNEIKTSPNVMLTSSSIFSTSKQNTVMTTLPGTQTSGESSLISTLKPLDVSEFTVNVTFHNESFINVRCQHSSFNYSSSTIRIKVKGGNDYGACSRYSCNGCARLPNGIECSIPYTPGEELQCILDDAFYDIPVQNMTSPGNTTTLLQILTTQHINTAPWITSTRPTSNSKESLTTSPESSATSQNAPITTTTQSPTTPQNIITTTMSLTTSQYIFTTTTQTSTTSKDVTTTTQSTTTSQNIITTKKSNPTTTQKIITTTHMPLTSQRGTTANIQTTLVKITTTKSNPTTQSIATSTRKSFETPHGNIKSTTPAKETYRSSGVNVVQRPLINAAVLLIVATHCLKYM